MMLKSGRIDRRMEEQKDGRIEKDGCVDVENR